VSDERIAAMALYSTRFRDVLTQRIDVQTRVPEPHMKKQDILVTMYKYKDILD